MSQRPDTNDYKRLFLEGAALVDVRAPVEFEKGSFPTAINLPLMMDDEREKVGICFKEQGQDAAIALGHELVHGDVKAQRVKAWKDFAAQNPEGYMFCFRGGLRSQTSRQWLKEAGINYPLVEGGYKALRRFLIDEMDRIVDEKDFIVIAGRTGVGKTILLNQLPKSVDLEGYANHRGSSFGRRIGDQPTPINFENAVAIRLLQLVENFDGPIFVEDESRNIGGISLPLSMADMIGQWPMLIVDEPMEERANVIQKDYVTDMLAEHMAAYGDEGFAIFSEYLTASLGRIKKRLGSERHVKILSLMTNALDQQHDSGDETLHRLWIEALLNDYYDPMYDYQLSNKSQPIVFKGSRAEVLKWHASS